MLGLSLQAVLASPILVQHRSSSRSSRSGKRALGVIQLSELSYARQLQRGGLCRQQSGSFFASATTAQTSNVLQEDWTELAITLSGSSPFEIVRKALKLFGNDIAIAFSGAEDVALIEYAYLTGLPFRVFTLETGRLNPETYKLFDDVEKRYNIHIEYMFPDATQVETMVRAKGLFSFYEEGHEECCRIRKVKPLRRALKGLRAWITGQRKDQSPGTRFNIPIVQVDPSFEGVEGGVGSLVKWNPLANVTSSEIWNFLRTMEVPVNALHSQGFVSIGCQPCTRTVLPGQHEREGRWWWEDATAKECGLHKGNLDGVTSGISGGSSLEGGPAYGDGFPDIFTGQNVTTLTREDMENLVAKPRDKAVFVVLYAPWCQFSQAMDEAFNEVADLLAESSILVGKFRADREQKEFSKEKLKLKSFPTILFLPKDSTVIVKYLSERRSVEALLAFVKSFR